MKKGRENRLSGSIGKQQLADMFAISLSTLARLLKKIPGVENTGKRRILYPNEIEIIFAKLGKPKQWVEVNERKESD